MTDRWFICGQMAGVKIARKSRTELRAIRPGGELAGIPYDKLQVGMYTSRQKDGAWLKKLETCSRFVKSKESEVVAFIIVGYKSPMMQAKPSPQEAPGRPKGTSKA